MNQNADQFAGSRLVTSASSRMPSAICFFASGVVGSAASRSTTTMYGSISSVPLLNGSASSGSAAKATAMRTLNARQQNSSLDERMRGTSACRAKPGQGSVFGQQHRHGQEIEQ